MVKTRLFFSLTALGFLFAASGSAATVYLNDWCFNNNGNTAVCNNGAAAGSAPATFDATLSAGNTVTNTLGSVSFSLAGGQSAGVYFNYNLASNAVNDYATVNGALGSGFSYEITDLNNTGNYDGSGNAFIWNHFGIGDAGTSLNLQDTNGAATGNGSIATPCCDVGWAMAFTASQAGTVTFTVSPNNPGGFYLEELNVGDGVTINSPIYLSASFSPSGGSSPEPATALLVIPAIALLAAAKRRKDSAV